MRDGLGAGARGVDVGGGLWAEDCEGGGGEALWGNVDVGASEGGGGGEEDWLGEGLFGGKGGGLGVCFVHWGRGWMGRGRD